MRDGVILSFVAVVTLILYLTLTRDSFLANDTSAHSSSTKVVANPSENAIGKTYRGGLVKSSPGRAWPGFTLYPTVGDAHVRILNMLGEPVHSWNVDAMRAQLLPNCRLLVVHGTKWGMRNAPWKDLKPIVREYNWQGKVVWEYAHQSRVHHDIQRLSSGNSLFPIKVKLDAKIFRTVRHVPKGIREISSDAIVEIDAAGKELWRWYAHEHLDMASCGRLPCSEQLNKSGWTHMNTAKYLPPNKWYDNGDERFKPGNVLTMLRNWAQAMIIDKESQRVVWSYGGDYRGGLSGGHEATMIQRGLPGAGNILLFDNGRYHHTGESIVLEINPVSKKIVWKYEDGERFYSYAAGSVQRLPNGNTLISQDTAARVFEVTPHGEIVWEHKGNLRTARAARYEQNYCEELSKLPLH